MSGEKQQVHGQEYESPTPIPAHGKVQTETLESAHLRTLPALEVLNLIDATQQAAHKDYTARQAQKPPTN